MPRIFEGKLSAEGFRFAIIVSRFNDFISSKLVEGAMDASARCCERAIDACRRPPEPRSPAHVQHRDEAFSGLVVPSQLGSFTGSGSFPRRNAVTFLLWRA